MTFEPKDSKGKRTVWQALFRTERWYRFVDTVEEEMLYGPEIKTNKAFLDLAIFSPGDLVQVEGRWRGIKRILAPATIVLLDGVPIRKDQLPDEVHYRHKREGSLMTLTLMLTFGALVLAAIGVIATIASVIIALAPMIGSSVLTAGAICVVALLIWWLGFPRLH